MIGWLILYNRQRRLAEEIEEMKRRLGVAPPPPPRGDEVRDRTIACLIILAFVILTVLVKVG
jgi:hypothetical protein